MTVTDAVNENDTITFEPSTDFVGTDTFSYVIADSEGNTDEGKVSADVRRATDDKQPDVSLQTKFIKSTEHESPCKRTRAKGDAR